MDLGHQALASVFHALPRERIAGSISAKTQIPNTASSQDHFGQTNVERFLTEMCTSKAVDAKQQVFDIHNMQIALKKWLTQRVSQWAWWT